MGDILVDFKPMDPKFPACFTITSTRLIQSHFANTVELHLTLKTGLAPVVDQVKLGFGSWLLMFW